MSRIPSKFCDNLVGTLHETFDDDNERVCLACFNSVIGGPTYILETFFGSKCFLHKSCAELPGEIRHPLHQHPLRGAFLDLSVCNGCSQVSSGFIYRCLECHFKLHVQCVSENEGQALKERVETYSNIYHPHRLQLVSFHSLLPTQLLEGIVCCCCLKSFPVRDPPYACIVCFDKSPFFIHKSCLDTLPRQVQSLLHPEHPLFIQPVHSKSYCEVCDDEIIGIALTCDSCNITFHVSCGSRTTRGFRLRHHHHEMHYVISKPPDHPRQRRCTICRAQCEGAFYRCIKCDVNVHMKCIPLSETVEHESHDHPLKLTDSVVTHRHSDEYRCDICEEEGNIKHHSYYCNECNYIAHIECVHSEEHEDDTSLNISSINLEGKGKAEQETDDVEEETDDAKEKTRDEVLHETDRSTQDDSDTPWKHSRDGGQFPGNQHQRKLDVDKSIVLIRRRIEELALQLEADDNLDKRSFKEDLVALVFQLDDLRGQCCNLHVMDYLY